MAKSAGKYLRKPAGQVMLPLVMAAILAAPHPVYASDPPVPQRKMSVEQLEKQLAREKKQEKELAARLEDIEKELKRTRSKLVNLTENIQAQEQKLYNLEEDTDKLQDERRAIKDRLQSQYGSISRLALALQRLRRMPPEAIVMRPEPPIETARSALLLQSMLPSIYQRAERLSQDLNRLDVLTQEIAQDRKIIENRKAKLDKEYAGMAEMIETRTRLYKSTQGDYKARLARIDRLAKESETLQELMENLEKERREQERKEEEAIRKQQQERTASQKAITKKIIPYLPGGGSGPRLPVAGTIKTGFGDVDGFGAKSKGIEIESRDGAVVVAPMAGAVRFVGSLKHRSNIVVLEHQDGYHSLIAGLDRIDTVVGQEMDSGEPIGLLISVNDRNPVLYYELRHKGEPVPPSRKIAGPGS